jgi:hypothetical protein
MTTSSNQINEEKNNVFLNENQKTGKNPRKTAAYLEAMLKQHDFGYYVKNYQSKFKKSLIESATKRVDMVLNHFTMGLITNNEKDNLIVDIWLHSNCRLLHFIIHDCSQEQGPYNYNRKSQKRETEQPEKKRYVMVDKLSEVFSQEK